RQRPQRVDPLRREAVASADQSSGLSFGQALGVAARAEVAPAGPAGRHPVLDSGARLIQEDAVRPALVRANAQLGLLVAEQSGAVVAKLAPEAADSVEHLS